VHYPPELRLKDELQLNSEEGCIGKEKADNPLSTGMEVLRFHLIGSIPPVRLKLACDSTLMTVFAYKTSEKRRRLKKIVSLPD